MMELPCAICQRYEATDRFTYFKKGSKEWSYSAWLCKRCFVIAGTVEILPQVKNILSYFERKVKEEINSTPQYGESASKKFIKPWKISKSLGRTMEDLMDENGVGK
jgi:hypothetical protein